MSLKLNRGGSPLDNSFRPTKPVLMDSQGRGLLHRGCLKYLQLPPTHTQSLNPLKPANTKKGRKGVLEMSK